MLLTERTINQESVDSSGLNRGRGVVQRNGDVLAKAWLVRCVCVVRCSCWSQLTVCLFERTANQSARSFQMLCRYRARAHPRRPTTGSTRPNFAIQDLKGNQKLISQGTTGIRFEYLSLCLAFPNFA